MTDQTVVVEGLEVAPGHDLNLRDEVWSLALDQRTFGPRRLIVAFADPSGRLLRLAHCPVTTPPDLALECCLDSLGAGAAAAVAFSDETVVEGPPPPDLADRFARARAVAAHYGVNLVDWIGCDDLTFRSSKLADASCAAWWDVI